MNKKRNFLIWYFSNAVKDFLIIWTRLVIFCLHFFSIKTLIKTLFSPWKRDVLEQPGKGFDIVFLVKKVVLDTIFRFFGAFVRTGVILFGLIIAFKVFVLGLGLFIAWLSLPLLVIFIFDDLGIIHPEWQSWAWLVVLLQGLFSIIAYVLSQKTDPTTLNLEDAFKQKWFSRVLSRAEVEESVGSEVLGADNLSTWLKQYQLNNQEFQRIVYLEALYQKDLANKRFFWRKGFLNQILPIGRYWHYGYTYFLDQSSIDLTEFDPTEYSNSKLVGHTNELELVVMALEKSFQNNVILIGGTGVGKKTLFHRLAYQVRFELLDKKINEFRFLLVDLALAVAKARESGRDVNSFVNGLFTEASNAGNIVLILENVGNFLEPSENFPINLGAIIDKYLNLPSFRMIMTATENDFHRVVEKHQNVLKNCQLIEVDQYDEDQTIEVLYQNFKKMEKYSILFSYQGFREIVRLSDALGRIAPLPGRAVNLANDMISFARKKAYQQITKEVVLEFVSMKTGFNQGAIGETEKNRLLNLEDILHQRVVGQRQAISQLSNAVRKMRAGIRDKKRPVGSFLFFGPTGVGKTETAKALAETYFGNENRMLRFDMSEFQNQTAIDRLIGSKILNQTGILTSQVKDKPYSLILLDEIEKAYPGVLDLFLQVLDEGVIKNGFDETISFRNCIIIATSNAGAGLIQELVRKGVDAEEINLQLTDEIVKKDYFRVEFLNRFDDLIFFSPLDSNQLISIVSLKLAKISQRIDREKGISITFGEGVPMKIIEKGYDPVFGARSIIRYLSKNIEDQIARKIISGDSSAGSQIHLTVEDMI